MILLRLVAILLLGIAATPASAQGMIPNRPNAVTPDLPSIPTAPSEPGLVTILQLPRSGRGTVGPQGASACSRMWNCRWDAAARKEECTQARCPR
jgi:hypothetical protein